MRLSKARWAPPSAMANPEHLQILKQGIEAWNAWREQHRDVRPDLSEADLHDANLSGAAFYRANLYRASLYSTDFSGADLTGANFRRADVSYAIVWETVFSDTDLTSVRGLATFHHYGPSTLDHRTLAQSGPLPIIFLRGCGLNDWEIEVTKLYQPGLTPTQINDILYRIYGLRADPLIQFYSCFISYNHTDAVFAHSLHARLQDRGIRCWLDEHQMLPGDDLYTQIDRGIRLWDKVLLCCSTAALTSWWIDYEIDLAFEKERNLMRTRGEKVGSVLKVEMKAQIRRLTTGKTMAY
jgi:hypothetical protein